MKRAATLSRCLGAAFTDTARDHCTATSGRWASALKRKKRLLVTLHSLFVLTAVGEKGRDQHLRSCKVNPKTKMSSAPGAWAQPRKVFIHEEPFRKYPRHRCSVCRSARRHGCSLERTTRPAGQHLCGDGILQRRRAAGRSEPANPGYNQALLQRQERLQRPGRRPRPREERLQRQGRLRH